MTTTTTTTTAAIKHNNEAPPGTNIRVLTGKFQGRTGIVLHHTPKKVHLRLNSQGSMVEQGTCVYKDQIAVIKSSLSSSNNSSKKSNNNNNKENKKRLSFALPDKHQSSSLSSKPTRKSTGGIGITKPSQPEKMNRTKSNFNNGYTSANSYRRNFGPVAGAFVTHPPPKKNIVKTKFEDIPNQNNQAFTQAFAKMAELYHPFPHHLMDAGFLIEHDTGPDSHQMTATSRVWYQNGLFHRIQMNKQTWTSPQCPF